MKEVLAGARGLRRLRILYLDTGGTIWTGVSWKLKKAALKVILRNDYKDYEDALRQMKLQSLEKEGSEQSMVCRKTNFANLKDRNM